MGVTADRRRDELAGLLESRGARVVLAPALRIVPITDDAELKAATRACLDRPPDIVLVNTGIGMRGWLEAAEGWGLAEPLRAALARAYLIGRGPKARAAIRAAGLHDQWSPEGEGIEEVLDHLAARGIAGLTVAIATARREPARVHRGARDGRGPGDRGAGLPLGAAHRPGPAARLVDLITGRLVDAVTFTAASAVHALLRAAGPGNDALLDALREHVLAACVGPVTAAPLRRHDVPSWPRPGPG